MDIDSQNRIYDRLLAINLTTDIDQIPNPVYINTKLGECHVLIEEIEKYSIRVSKEISIIQRALNDSIAEYETKRETILIQDEEIQSLPNIKDREAMSNNKLRNELVTIKNLKNHLSDFNNLSRAINLKLKNLNRANTDIKIQMRLMESQIKLGSLPTDEAAKSLAEEMKKGIYGKDSFENAETKVEETKIADPSQNLDINSILVESITDPSPMLGENEDLTDVENSDEQDETENIEEQGTTEDSSEDILKEVQESIINTATVDLDKILIQENGSKTIEQTGGDDNKKEKESVTTESRVETKKQTQKSDDIDIDMLLKQWA